MDLHQEAGGTAVPTPEERALLDRARAVAGNAHSPYSGVRVGAALVGASGAVHLGCNVENASYGVTLCAERSALARAVSDGEHELRALYLWASPGRLLMPCGMCRQALWEFAPDLEVWVESAGAGPLRTTLRALLPAGVSAADLGD